jgi:hypothetical protein
MALEGTPTQAGPPIAAFNPERDAATRLAELLVAAGLRFPVQICGWDRVSGSANREPGPAIT